MTLINFKNDFEALTKETDFLSISDDKSRLLLALYSYYHYFLASNDDLDELEKGLLSVPEVGHHIGGVFLGDSDSGPAVDFIISDYKEIPFSTMEDFQNTLTRTLATIDSYLANRSSVDPTLAARVEQIKDDSGEKILHYNVVLITNQVANSEEKETMLQMVDTVNEKASAETSAMILFGDDIASIIQDVEHPTLYVHRGQLIMENPNAFVYHRGYDLSLLTTISAKSLRKMYEDFHNNGLFAMNLRYYIKLDRVDSPIKDTIQNHGEDFWYFNNGIIVLCDDYSIKGDVISLTNFSIVNGAQTTTLIGTTPFVDDFYVVAKIIKNDRQQDEKEEFAAKVAEASNSQKQIKIKDIISNREEQRALKSRLSEVGVFTLVKRGDIPTSKIEESWKKTSNNEIAQLVYSFVYAQPGTARISISKLLSDDEAYGLIFKVPFCNDLYLDLLHLRSIFKKWKKELASSRNYDPAKVEFMKTGMFPILALFGIACKLCFNPTLSHLLVSTKDDGDCDKRDFYLKQPDINHRLFVSFEDEKAFFLAFDYLYESFLITGYKKRQFDHPGDYSNFTKNQGCFMQYCVGEVVNQLSLSKEKLPEGIVRFILPLLVKADESRNEEWLRPFVEEYNPKMMADLNAVTIKLSRTLLVPTFNILTTCEKNLIIKIRPTTIEGLIDYAGIDENRAKKIVGPILSVVNANPADHFI